MWVAQAKLDSLNRELADARADAAGAHAEATLLRHQLSVYEEELKGLRADLKTERKENAKHELALLDRIAQSHNQKPVSEQPKKEKPEGEQKPRLTPTEQVTLDFYRRRAVEEGQPEGEGDVLFWAEKRGEKMPYERLN